MIGPLVTDALDDGEFPCLPSADQRRQGAMQRGLAGDRHHLIDRQAEGGAQGAVGIVAVGDQGIQPVIAALQLYQN